MTNKYEIIVIGYRWFWQTLERTIDSILRTSKHNLRVNVGLNSPDPENLHDIQPVSILSRASPATFGRAARDGSAYQHADVSGFVCKAAPGTPSDSVGTPALTTRADIRRSEID
jgi:hypothetical protein